MQFEIISVFDAPAENMLGNTAAVVLLSAAVPDSQMQLIAGDFNQPATTFLWPSKHGDGYNVRWFAPDAEIGLCGHGTLAALAFIRSTNKIDLHFRRGIISGYILDPSHATMELHAIPVQRALEVPEKLRRGLGVPVIAQYQTPDKHIVLVDNEENLRAMQPDFSVLKEIDVFGYAVTAPGNKADFVSRTLVPHVQQLEDHATGSSHAALTPFWSKRLKKDQLTALQLSPRGGSFQCRIMEHGMVALTGHFRSIARGTLSHD